METSAKGIANVVDNGTQGLRGPTRMLTHAASDGGGTMAGDQGTNADDAKGIGKPPSPGRFPPGMVGPETLRLVRERARLAMGSFPYAVNDPIVTLDDLELTVLVEGKFRNALADHAALFRTTESLRIRLDEDGRFAGLLEHAIAREFEFAGGLGPTLAHSLHDDLLEALLRGMEVGGESARVSWSDGGIHMEVAPASSRAVGSRRGMDIPSPEQVDAALDQWFARPDWREFYADGPDVRAYMTRALEAAMASSPFADPGSPGRVADLIVRALRGDDRDGGHGPRGKVGDDAATRIRFRYSEAVARGVREGLCGTGALDTESDGPSAAPPGTITLLCRLYDAVYPFADVGAFLAIGGKEGDDAEVAVRVPGLKGERAITKGEFKSAWRVRRSLLSCLASRDTDYDDMVAEKKRWERRALAAEAELAGRAAPTGDGA